MLPARLSSRSSLRSSLLASTAANPGFGHAQRPSAPKWTRNIASNTSQQPPPFAFVFDIDGVLLRGRDVLPAAKRALNILEGDNVLRKKIPYILLTNGGGVGEHERCEKLSAQLGLPISTSQYCQAHTILKKFSHKYADKPVLVLGGKLDTVRKVAHGYASSPQPICYADIPRLQDMAIKRPSPLWTSLRGNLQYGLSTHFQMRKSELRWYGPRATATPQFTIFQPVDFSKTPISAIFVYHDPRNWALDVQVACDVIQSGGIIGGPYVNLKDQDEPVELIFCNPDLLWKSDFDRPRLGQGAFKAAFQAVFQAVIGSEYPHVQFGKPTEATYEFAEELLKVRVQEMYGSSTRLSPHIYMVGDNPESDIAGANSAEWSSVLVRTGVYEPSHGPPPHLPTHYADDVEEAVKWAVDREMTRLGSHLTRSS
ncbi:unnamed protein product [Cyclocybe aegerita]|uniref:Uncharacterized protein n=1 Tax=Cyclocybe aegerita TaxID=1973307 RepID=A0A8S0VSZ6_CYCAE|nr:unnamed protein product [Cyclocybe aegerita]